VGLPLPFRTPHLSPRSFLWKFYLRRGFLLLLFYQFIASPLPPLLLLPCARPFHAAPERFRYYMPIKRVAYRSKMAKKGMKKQTSGWIPSSFDETDLKKSKKEGFLPESSAIIYPRDEAIPASPAGYRVMFLAFLLRGLSLPAHEFLCGLLFVYGMQLHQLTPNSLLHIACFITRCEAFLGIDPTGFFGSISFAFVPVVL
jgi:hypothetical protein